MSNFETPIPRIAHIEWCFVIGQCHGNVLFLFDVGVAAMRASSALYDLAIENFVDLALFTDATKSERAGHHLQILNTFWACHLVFL